MFNFNPSDGIRFANDLPKHTIQQLETFRAEIEKCYFSKVLIRVMSYNNSTIEIGIEFQSNFSLSESITHFNDCNWLNSKEANISILAFEKFNNALQSLKENSNFYIDIAELSIYLKETSVTIGKVYENSISENYESIINLLIKRMKNFIEKKLEVPSK